MTNMDKKQFTEDQIKRAKSKDIVEFLRGNGIEVKAKGRTSVCSSPFPSDSTPSFVVYTDENRFHDFSSGNHGDIIELASKLLNIGFQESVEILSGEQMVTWDEKKYEKRSKKKNKW